MKKILVCANADRVEKSELVVEKILAEGFDTKVYFPFRSSENFKYPHLICEDHERDAADSDMLVCMGGDGTILACSKLAARFGLPVLGINYGHKGFIAALEPEEVELLGDILKGEFVTENRMMLEAKVIRNGETVFEDFGLNETVIKSAVSHPVKVKVFGDDVEISAFSGDGIIVATPTGSTAYSMSAGGPIVEPNAENLILTPICAHSLNPRTVVLRGSRKVNIKLSSKVDTVLALDGNTTFSVFPDDIIEITKSRHITKLVVGTKRSFYEIVKQKLNTDF